MAEFLCNQLDQHLILMDGATIYAPSNTLICPPKHCRPARRPGCNPAQCPVYWHVDSHARHHLAVLLPALQANSSAKPCGSQRRHCLLSNLRRKNFCRYLESAINLCRRSPMQQYKSAGKNLHSYLQTRAKTFLRSACRKYLNMDSSQTVATGMTAACFIPSSKKERTLQPLRLQGFPGAAGRI